MSWTETKRQHTAFAKKADENYDAVPPQRGFTCDLWELSDGHDKGRWARGVADPVQCMTPCQLRIIFAPLDLPSPSSKDNFLRLFAALGIPSSFSLERVRSVSHSFGSLSDSHGTRTWFHFLCKHVRLLQTPNSAPEVIYHADADVSRSQIPLNQMVGQSRLSQADYSYVRSGFFLNTTGDGCITLVCFGATHQVRARLEEFTSSDMFKDAITEPNVLLDLVMDGLYQEVDENVWNMNKVFGSLEHLTLTLANARHERFVGSKMPFVGLHNVAKHIIHLGEAVESCLLTIDRIIDEIRRENSGSGGLLHRNTSSSTTFTPTSTVDQLRSCLSYRGSLFLSTKLRLNSLSKRVDNAITLAFNTVTQHDSMVMRQDSNSMKIIATITIIFLPTTAIATVVGSQLFVSEFQDGAWLIRETPLFAVLWWVTIPLTLIIGVLGWLWHWWTSNMERERPPILRKKWLLSLVGS